MRSDEPSKGAPGGMSIRNFQPGPAAWPSQLLEVGTKHRTHLANSITTYRRIRCACARRRSPSKLHCDYIRQSRSCKGIPIVSEWPKTRARIRKLDVKPPHADSSCQGIALENEVIRSEQSANGDSIRSLPATTRCCKKTFPSQRHADRLKLQRPKQPDSLPVATRARSDLKD